MRPPGAVIVLKDSLQQWRIVAHVRDGQLGEPPFATSVPVNGSAFTARFARAARADVSGGRAGEDTDLWPGVLAFHRSRGRGRHRGLSAGVRRAQRRLPRPDFQARRRRMCRRSELLVALAQQATLAVQLTRLAYSAKEAAVLMERTRIGQEIHDGLAQAFTGILLQLGAVEEFPSCTKRGSELARDADRASASWRATAWPRRAARSWRCAWIRRAARDWSSRCASSPTAPRCPAASTCSFEGGGIATGLTPGARARAAAHRAGGGEQCGAAWPSAHRAHHHDR